MLSSASVIVQKHEHSELVNFKSFTKSKFRRTAETEKAAYEIPKAGREGEISYPCLQFSPNDSTELTHLNPFRLPIIEFPSLSKKRRKKKREK